MSPVKTIVNTEYITPAKTQYTENCFVIFHLIRNGNGPVNLIIAPMMLMYLYDPYHQCWILWRRNNKILPLHYSILFSDIDYISHTNFVLPNGMKAISLHVMIHLFWYNFNERRFLSFCNLFDNWLHAMFILIFAIINYSEYFNNVCPTRNTHFIQNI